MAQRKTRINIAVMRSLSIITLLLDYNFSKFVENYD